MTREELKQKKAREQRYRKPIVRDICIDHITERLWDIQSECEDVRWFWDGDDENLVNALDGDEDEAYEFRMMFSDLCADCEQMMNDLQETWVPDCFDKFFVAIGGGRYGGGILGFDEYEGDYFGIDYDSEWVSKMAGESLMNMTKKELIEAAGQCFRVYMQFHALEYRYEGLKACLEILQEKNAAVLRAAKEINDAYEKANAESFYSWKPEVMKFEKLIKNLPQEEWIR